MRLRLIPLLLLPLCMSAVAADVPPESSETMVNAGFLDSHPDMMYRQWGVNALHRGKVDEAMENFRLAARYADKPAQGYLGEMYWFGVERPADRVMAFAWMDVAAERGYPLLVELRDQYWAALPLEQHEAAREQARLLAAEYGDAVARPRIDAVLIKGLRAMTGSRTGSMSNNVDIVYSEGGMTRTIKADRMYDKKYWDPKLYQQWQDDTWMKIRRGTVEVGTPAMTIPSATDKP